MKKTDLTVYAYAWYKPEQWALLKAYSVDKENIEDTFSEWAQNAERSYEEHQQSGMNVHKVVIDIDALVSWCRENGFQVDGEGRSRYAATLLKEMND